MTASISVEVPVEVPLGELIDKIAILEIKLERIEDDIRGCERDKDFGDRFVELARGVYVNDDQPSRLKRETNELLGSRLIEEKSYAAY